MDLIQVKKLYEDAKLPWKEPNSVGYDLYTHSCIPHMEDGMGGIYTIGFGIAVRPPEGYYLQIAPRSSLYKAKLLLTNSLGIIDPEYTGELKAVVLAFDKPPEVGARYFQLLLVPFPQSQIEEVTELPETNRGSGGFGSTGTH